ncbi:DUF1236 domain-containing protein [Mesorhizobium sp. M0152]|uniref:DUF1236 domain-containing protein n=1 Tax=Mesorhizobium sp. M0152 TaxID=2956898 RepID=UPI003338EF74
MKTILITSVLALGVGCGAAIAQTQQSGGATQSDESGNCVTGSTNCKNGKTEQQTQGKAGTTTEQQMQGKAGTTTEQQTQGKAGTKTEQQTQGKAGTTTEQQAQGKAATTTEQQTQGKTATTTDQQAQGKTGTTTDQNSTASINNVTVEQKTEITNVIRETKVEPVADIGVDISVGVTVPKKVRLHRLPKRIVKIVPAYEAYEYFVLADGRIVIVDPNSYTIVAILT